MKKWIVITGVFIFALNYSSNSQGCIAIRNLPAGFGQFASLGYSQSTDKWMLDINNRYFESSTGYVGTKSFGKDQYVTLYEFTTNFELTRLLSKGWSLSLDMPIASNTVAAPQNSSGIKHSSHAYGIGDMRLMVYKWLLRTDVYRKGNIQFGLGIKFPTGNYKSVDYWYYSDNPVVKGLEPVNVAIQLGDGGTGIATQLNGYYIFNKMISVYADFFYLISPNNTTGVATWPPGFLPPDQEALDKQTTNNVNSIPDNYTLTAGANLTFKRLVFTAGLHYEGGPAHDLVGQNDGLRRVGHIFSIEPGLQFKFKSSILYFSVSVPVDRATIQTVPDQRQEAITGISTTTGGHFADVLYYFGYTFTF